MRTFIVIALILLTLSYGVTEYLDGFRLSWIASRDFVSFKSAKPATDRDSSVRLTARLREAQVPESMSSWSVVDAFPECKQFSGAMHMLPHPFKPRSWYVATFDGKIFSVTRDSEGLDVKTVVDLSCEQMGWLYTIAVHPQMDRGKSEIYVFYRSPETASYKFYRVACCPVFEDRVSTYDDQHILIEQQIEHTEHLGSGMDFDDSGFLLVGVGDNGLYDDSSRNSQKLSEGLFSGVLRLDVDRQKSEKTFASPRLPVRGHSGGYNVPKDNPFVDVNGALPEFWAIGFRNPFRLYFDRELSGAWVGEVGQKRIEQLEFVTKGSNHLWSLWEGSEKFERSYLRGGPQEPKYGKATFPYYEYLHVDQDYCIVAGPVYKSDRYPELNGKVLFGDNQSGRIWAIDRKDPTNKRLLLRLPSDKSNSSLTSICVDLEGHIYTTSFASPDSKPSIFELVPIKPKELPDKLSDTGFFNSMSPLEPVSGFLAYDINSPFWSDGLLKTRWFKIPDQTKIDNAGNEFAHWRFPEGTVFIKHFCLPRLQANLPMIPVETRILIWGRGNYVYGASYRWSDDGHDAFLVTERDTLKFETIQDIAEDQKAMTYRLPGPDDCLVCHSRDYQALGMTSAQLNRLDGKGNNYLIEFSKIGILSSGVKASDIAKLKRLSNIDDESVDVDHRIRSYLHSNCSFCHHENGTQRTQFIAEFNTELGNAKMVGEQAITYYMQIDGRSGGYVVAPGSPDGSILYRRFLTGDLEYSMPHLGRNTVDHKAAALLHKWISELPH